MGEEFSTRFTWFFRCGMIWLFCSSQCWAEQKAVVSRTRLPAHLLKNAEPHAEKHWRYLLYLPDAYRADGPSWPMILFLHGRSLRGSDIEMIKRYGPPAFLDKKGDFPFVVVSPQLPDELAWPAQSLLELLDEIVKEYRVDSERIYLTGVSMGGGGAWDLAAADQKRFAAMAPLCGYGDIENINLVNDLPIWAFHGDADQVVPLGPHQRLVDAVNKAGGKAKLTAIQGGKHGDIIYPTYSNHALYDWFLGQTRAPKKAEPVVVATPVETPKNEKTMLAGLLPNLRQHIVKRGDSLWELSRTYGVTIEALMKANSLPNSTIRVNQTLVIPTDQIQP